MIQVEPRGGARGNAGRFALRLLLWKNFVRPHGRAGLWSATLLNPATLPTSSESALLHRVAQLRSDSLVLPLDIRNFEIEKVDIMPSPLPFLLTLCVVLVCVWLWWRSNKQ